MNYGMKTAFSIACGLVLLLLSSCGGGLAHDTPNALTESVFATLVQDDLGALGEFLPGVEDLRETYEKALEKAEGGRSPEWDEEQVKGAVKEIKTQMNALWREVRDAGVQNGIDWGTAKQKGLTTKSDTFVESSNARLAEVELTFASGDADYKLLVGAAEYERGWLLARLSLGK